MVTMIVGVVGWREDEQHEPHGEGHAEDAGGFSELQIRAGIGYDDDSDGPHYVMIVHERFPHLPEVYVHGYHIVSVQHTGTRVQQMRDLQICRNKYIGYLIRAYSNVLCRGER